MFTPRNDTHCKRCSLLIFTLLVSVTLLFEIPSRELPLSHSRA
ncbi:hypothetical protein PPRY_a1377 [Pseudoalteromonas prydzensis ACAM 620]|nr:hypothetical protein [Pseudoalteromonas prydzensis ACAM 620]